MRSNYFNLLACLVLVSITFIVYSPAAENQFLHWDDQYYITENPIIRNSSEHDLSDILVNVTSLNYHPVTMASLWANAKISGTEEARPYILTNIIVHCLNVGLLFWLVSLIFRNQFWVSTTTALIFALHPFHVESVVWVSERKDVLYTFFFILSLAFYQLYSKQKRKNFYFLSFLTFLLSCLSKAMAVSLVPCLFLLDYINQQDFSSYKLYLKKLSFVLLALAIGFIAINIQSGGSALAFLDITEKTKAVSEEISLLNRIINAGYANHYYLQHFLFPSNLSAFHPYSLMEKLSSFHVVFSQILLILMILIGFFTRRKSIVFGFMFYLFTILLVSQIIPVGSAIVAERYTYVPYIGLSIFLGDALHIIWKTKMKIIAPLVILAMSICFTLKTMEQIKNWESHTKLFTQVVEQYPQDAYARVLLSSGLWVEGQIDDALIHLHIAVDSLEYDSSLAYDMMGNCYADMNDVDQALEYFNLAIYKDFNNYNARYNRALLLLDIDPLKAINDFDICERSPNTYVQQLIYAPRGRAYGLLGNYKLSVRDLNEAIRRFPNDPYNYLDRSIGYKELGMIEEAQRDLSKHRELLEKYAE